MEKKVATAERIKMLKAMEYIARQVNDEMVFEGWLYNGIADGDIEYGDLNVNEEDYEALEFYCENENFSDIMGTFLRLMKNAIKSGGLYCDGVIDNLK